MKKLLFLLAFFFAASLCGRAQDTIVKKNGDILRVKVTEVGTEEIKFKTFGVTDGPIIAIKKEEVRKLIVSGQVIINEKEPVKEKGEDILVKQDGSTLKINVLDIGTTEVKFKLVNDPDGPTISINKSDIKTLKVGDQIVIDNKKETEDIILKKDGTTVKAKIMQIGTESVTYHLYTSPDGPVLSMKKKDIKSIKIDGQIVYEFKEDPYTISNNSILDNTNDIKFHFFSPLVNHLAFSYEWMQRPGFNFEAGFGIIGVGVNGLTGGTVSNTEREHPSGFFVRGGPKFLLGNSSDIEIEGARIAHPMKGRYFEIEVTLLQMKRGYKADTASYYYGGTPKYTSWQNRYSDIALNLIYGRQNIYGNVITVGYYLGLGYAIEGVTTTGNKPSSGQYPYISDFDPQRFSFLYLGPNFPLTFTYGFTVGYLFKPKDKVGDKNYRNNPRAPK